MKIPDTFYDKSISVLSKEDMLDIEGGFVSNASVEKDRFVGNVSFSNCKAIKEEYGIEEQIDIVVTAGIENKEKVQLTDLISYQGIKYEVTDKIVTDSHLIVVGSKWE